MSTSVEKRRKVRSLEARRDALMEKKTKSVAELAVVRTQLKIMRKK